jgi:hypothetical protein
MCSGVPQRVPPAAIIRTRAALEQRAAVLRVEAPDLDVGEVNSGLGRVRLAAPSVEDVRGLPDLEGINATGSTASAVIARVGAAAECTSALHKVAMCLYVCVPLSLVNEHVSSNDHHQFSPPSVDCACCETKPAFCRVPAGRAGTSRSRIACQGAAARARAETVAPRAQRSSERPLLRDCWSSTISAASGRSYRCAKTAALPRSRSLTLRSSSSS